MILDKFKLIYERPCINPTNGQRFNWLFISQENYPTDNDEAIEFYGAVGMIGYIETSGVTSNGEYIINTSNSVLDILDKSKYKFFYEKFVNDIKNIFSNNTPNSTIPVSRPTSDDETINIQVTDGVYYYTLFGSDVYTLSVKDTTSAEATISSIYYKGEEVYLENWVAQGTALTGKVEVDPGYILDKLYLYVDGLDDPIELTVNESGEFSFIMPGAQASLEATTKQDQE